jgi:hypothetical protein
MLLRITAVLSRIHLDVRRRREPSVVGRAVGRPSRALVVRRASPRIRLVHARGTAADLDRMAAVGRARRRGVHRPARGADRAARPRPRDRTGLNKVRAVEVRALAGKRDLDIGNPRQIRVDLSEHCVAPAQSRCESGRAATAERVKDQTVWRLGQGSASHLAIPRDAQSSQRAAMHGGYRRTP